eukprot:gene13236-17980_t
MAPATPSSAAARAGRFPNRGRSAPVSVDAVEADGYGEYGGYVPPNLQDVYGADFMEDFTLRGGLLSLPTALLHAGSRHDADFAVRLSRRLSPSLTLAAQSRGDLRRAPLAQRRAYENLFIGDVVLRAFVDCLKLSGWRVDALPPAYRADLAPAGVTLAAAADAVPHAGGELPPAQEAVIAEALRPFVPDGPAAARFLVEWLWPRAVQRAGGNGDVAAAGILARAGKRRCTVAEAWFTWAEWARRGHDNAWDRVDSSWSRAQLAQGVVPPDPLRRLDLADGVAYNAAEFQAHYGGDAEWRR